MKQRALFFVEAKGKEYPWEVQFHYSSSIKYRVADWCKERGVDAGDVDLGHYTVRFRSELLASLCFLAFA